MELHRFSILSFFPRALAILAGSVLLSMLVSACAHLATELPSDGLWTERQLADSAREAIRLKREKLVARGSKPPTQPQEANDFFLDQRLGEADREYPIDHVQNVLRKMRKREKALASSPLTGSPPGGIQGWTELGPGNIGGRTRALVIDPDQPDTMYAAGVSGGIWKTIDGGASWNVADDTMLNLAVCSLAMDPDDPSVLYAGTGEGFFGGNTARGLGIFKSEDAGASWALLDGTVNGVPLGSFHYVNKIAISPNDSNRIYAATRYGVWRSVDAGATWSVVLRNPTYLGGTPASNGCQVGCTDLVVRPDANPDILFAAFGSFQQDGLYRSDDGGDSWVGYLTPPNQGRMTLAFAPSNNDYVYLLMADNGSGGILGQVVSVFRSTDGGDFFESRPDFSHKFSPWLLSYSSIALGCVDAPVIYSQGWYDNIVAVDPIDPETVWVGGIDLYRSDDGGRTFGMAAYWFHFLLDPPPPTYVHPDQHFIRFHPDYNGTTNQTMFVTNDGGLFKTDNALAATTQEECPFNDVTDLYYDIGAPPEIDWQRLNNGYGVTQYYHGDTARDLDMFVGGAQDNGTSRVLAVDTPNEWKLIFSGDGGYVAIDPTDSQNLYIEIQFFPNIFKSEDGGETFEEATDGITDTDGLFITPFTMDLSHPEVLWTGGRRPWRTMNGAKTWEAAGPDFAGPATISAIAVAPSDGNVVYLGFNNGYVVRTTNGLSASPNWEIFEIGLFGGWVSSVAVDPVDPDVAYVTYSTFGIPHLLRTVNGGSTWAPIDAGIPDIPAHWIAVRPGDSSQLFVATELGVFVSDDGGGTWNPSNLGLPNTVVESLVFRDDDTLVAFTYGRGAFLASLAP